MLIEEQVLVEDFHICLKKTWHAIMVGTKYTSYVASLLPLAKLQAELTLKMTNRNRKQRKRFNLYIETAKFCKNRFQEKCQLFSMEEGMKMAVESAGQKV